jgi:hypothetical protein
VLDLRELGDCGLDGADDVALQHEVEVAHGTRLHLLEQVLDRDATRGLRELLAAQSLAARIRKVACTTLVLDDAAELARRRRLVESQNLDRIAGPRLLHLLAAEVVERAHLAPRVAGDDRVADTERAAVDEHRRNRPAADVEARLDDRA